MAAFIITLIVIWITMWGFFRFMYPKPPQSFAPKEGDIITPRDCDFCGYPLAEYRGVLEEKPDIAFTQAQEDEMKELTQSIQALTDSSATDTADDPYKAGLENTNSHESKLSARQFKKAQAAAQKKRQHTLATQQRELKKMQTWFFCNYEHQAAFHAQQEQHSQQTQPPKQDMPSTTSKSQNNALNPSNDT